MSAEVMQLNPRDEKALISKARRIAKRHGMQMTKSRERQHLNNHGQFQLVNIRSNTVVNGLDYDMTPQEVIEYCNDLDSAKET